MDVLVPSIDELLFMLDPSAYARLDGGAAATHVVDLTSLSTERATMA